MINCQNIKEYLNHYLDKALETPIRTEVEKHLATCPDCRRYFEGEVRLEKKLVEIIGQTDSSDEVIWQKTLARISRPKSHILRYLVPASAAACILIILTVLILFSPTSDGALLAEVAEQHRSALNPEIQLPVKTNSAEILSKQFSEQYNFNISECCCMIAKSGFTIKGGRMCRLKNQPTAHIVMDYQGTPVSLLLVIKDDDRFAGLTTCHKIYLTKIRDFNCAMVRLADHIIYAVGSVSPEVLNQLLTDTGATIKRCNQCP